MQALSTDCGDLSRLDVAIVQGSKGAQSFLRSMLGGLKVGRVRAYDTAEVALREMLMEPPTLLITDWEMKRKSGYWLVRQMRRTEMEPLCFVPAILLTAEMSWSMLDVALETGVNSVLLKPLSPQKLRERIDSVVNRPERFVEQRNGCYIAESARQALEERVRANETPEARAYRLHLRAALEQDFLEDEYLLEEFQQASGKRERGEQVGWKGWNAA